MKRDIKLVRDILKIIEKSKGEIVGGYIDWKEVKEELKETDSFELEYHLSLCEDMNFVIIKGSVVRLTWQGHDYLDTGRTELLPEIIHTENAP